MFVEVSIMYHLIQIFNELHRRHLLLWWKHPDVRYPAFLVLLEHPAPLGVLNKMVIASSPWSKINPIPIQRLMFICIVIHLIKMIHLIKNNHRVWLNNNNNIRDYIKEWCIFVFLINSSIYIAVYVIFIVKIFFIIYLFFTSLVV